MKPALAWRRYPLVAAERDIIEQSDSAVRADVGPIRRVLASPRPKQGMRCPCQPLVDLERRHAARPRGGDRLAEHLVLHVAGGKHALDRGSRAARLRQDVALCVHRHLSGEDRRVRRMADGDEHSVNRQPIERAGLHVAEPDPGNHLGRAAAFDFLHDAVPDHVDPGVGEQPRLQDLLGPQRVAAVDQRDAVGMVRQVQRLLDRGVAAADHRDRLAAVEEPVAGGAGRHAAALQPLLRLDVEPAGLRAGGDDHRVGQEHLARIGDGSGRGGAEKSTPVIRSWTRRVPTCSACAAICSISQGPG